jgi:outer membrane assembly lipoprotein YfiO
MKNYTFLGACAVVLMLASGCGKKEEKPVDVLDLTEKKKDMKASIFTAVNKRNYDQAQELLVSFIDLFPGDSEIASFKLMIADVNYERGRYAQAYEAYKHFQEYYPADQHAEYAMYKSAHAKFNQAHHAACDATPIEETRSLCREYCSRPDYLQYRAQIEDLARTCDKNLLDKELYVVNSYLTQQRFASARHRLDYVAQKFDLAENGKDHYLFYKAKLAKAENNQGELARMVDDLHEQYPHSPVTAMADRLVGNRGLLI